MNELRGPWERSQSHRETPGALEEGCLSTGAIRAAAAETPGRPRLRGRGRGRQLLSAHTLVESLQRTMEEDSVFVVAAVQLDSCPTLRFHGRQHARPPSPSLSPGVCSNSCPLSQ